MAVSNLTIKKKNWTGHQRKQTKQTVLSQGLGPQLVLDDGYGWDQAAALLSLGATTGQPEGPHCQCPRRGGNSLLSLYERVQMLGLLLSWRGSEKLSGSLVMDPVGARS
jgi:hypothetical protein